MPLTDEQCNQILKWSGYNPTENLNDAKILNDIILKKCHANVIGADNKKSFYTITLFYNDIDGKTLRVEAESSVSLEDVMQQGLLKLSEVKRNE